MVLVLLLDGDGGASDGRSGMVATVPLNHAEVTSSK